MGGDASAIRWSTGALVDAVAAPRTRENENLHFAHESTEQRFLFAGQRHRVVDGRPAVAVGILPVTREEVVIGKSLGEVLLPLQGDSSGQSDIGYRHTQARRHRTVRAHRIDTLGVWDLRCCSRG
jgi:hypothetical protein